MGLREIESTLPPGFRFYPSDEELVCHYLYKKVANERAAQGTLVEVDLHAREPWELPDAAKLTASEWYFFSFRDRKYATGSRTNRATKTGYWKATGKDREVRSPGPAASRAVVGMRKTLVFYQGRAPNGVKSCWVMHEFRLDSPPPPREDWVLCRVFQKRKDAGDASQQDSASSPTNCFAAASSSSQQQAAAALQDDAADQPQQPVMMHVDACYDVDHQAGFAPPHHHHHQESGAGAGGCFDPLMWQYGSALGHCFPQEVTSSPVMMGVGDGGCGFFYDSGFEDMANIGGGMGFPQPQGWMG
ncbi:unnamed protein product [Urochloa humidicola]